jgi:phenylpropionate dioxygenase-like ring-hydroxylating dioxygenase large terminal subunit
MTLDIVPDGADAISPLALHAADAYCLHLGANLGVRGTVAGEDIVCPWHGWQWSGEGCNTLIPDSEQRGDPAGSPP